MTQNEDTAYPRNTLKPRRKDSDDTILEIFRTHPDKFLTSREVSNQLEIKKRQTNNRLNELEELGKVESKSGGTSRIWWLADEDEYHANTASPIRTAIKNRLDIQFGLLGVGLGVLGSFAMVLYLGMSASEQTLPFLGERIVILSGFYGAIFGISFIAIGLIVFSLRSIRLQLGTIE